MAKTELLSIIRTESYTPTELTHKVQGPQIIIYEDTRLDSDNQKPKESALAW